MTVGHTVSPEHLPEEAKGLVFDLDGTVLDTMAHHWAAWRQLSQEFGFELTVAKLLALAGKPSTAIMELLCEEQGITTIDIPKAVQRKTELYVELAGETTVVECVMEIARAGKARGLPVAIATGGSRPQVTKALTAVGLLEGFFDAIVTCNDVTHGKPHPETFLRAAELIGVEPQHCVGYEDAPLGMQAIKAAGFLQAVDVTLLPAYPKLIE
ncbi:Fructose-1-phosphate phosphatase [Micractinium conductrix]|uniref:Fructose-1-phosphate phosphatase n=1 Tax=Micractinium conductrix TaxID=554055 RepID=A0A2P6V647_9CHLO|nr:Fructose-1-phosphate phosphatase [Micractinium conductrix]|eukprot:PSC69561.1 Fructose-1-phosphate phosphatase [Micractinium conductrix]